MKEIMIKKWQKRLIDTVVLSSIVMASLPPQATAQTGGAGNQPGHNSAPNEKRSFGGPDGVAGDLERTYENKESVVKKRPLQSYYDWKQRIQDEHGFSFGLSGYWLYQKASDSLGEEDDAWGLGFGWAEPTPKAGQSARDEYVIETSYKFQLLKSFSLLPDVQLVLDPANNPDKDSVWVVGLRGILTL